MLVVNTPSQTSILLSHAVKLMEHGERIALLTLVNIEGSAPYPVGAQMLVSERGESWGQITGGCAETALIEQAMLAIKENKNQTHRYGLNSLFMDIQLPCGSGIDVHFEVSNSLECYHQKVTQLIARQPAKLTLRTAKKPYTSHYLPCERLIVFGQGPILAHLAQQALACGFEVIVIVQDETDHIKLQKMGVHSATLQEAKGQYERFIDGYTAIVSLFHEHERETDILRHALASPAFYIGALGSKHTHAQRLSALKAAGFSDVELARIFGPVGMDINAATPSHIAISIIAQMIAQLPKPGE